MRLILFTIILISSLSYGQTKKELIDKVAKLEKSLDSLKKVSDNNENIIENRDRTIGFKMDDIAKLKEEKKAIQVQLDDKKKVISALRRRQATGESKIHRVGVNRFTFTVPSNRYWIINQVMVDYASGNSKDSTGNLQFDEIHVFIKSINGVTLSDPGKKVFGPKLFSSINVNSSMRLPMVLAEGTKIELEMYTGPIEDLRKYEGSIYLSVTEKESW